MWGKNNNIHGKYSNINQGIAASLPEVNHDEYPQIINIADNKDIAIYNKVDILMEKQVEISRTLYF